MSDSTMSVRNDLQPVVIGGDIGAYALGREMHEAFGVKSYCVAPSPIGAIAHSAIFEQYPVERLAREQILAALGDIAHKSAPKTVFVVSNADPLIPVLAEIAPQLPDNVVLPVPPVDVVDLVSDKMRFAELCARNGLETPRTEVAHLAGTDPIPPTQIDFPVVVKPARSPEYNKFIAQGFQKVYFVKSQPELDEVFSSLRAAGCATDMLVQELIGGDDTYADSVTLYIDSQGKTTLFASAHVLLGDHAPTMLGNPVAMVTQQVPELWERTSRMLAEVGYHGFANFDVKRDPKNPDRYVFFEVNPRIGRNSYYVCAGGVNPMRVTVADLVDHVSLEPQVAGEKVLYTLVPLGLLRKYVLDADLAAEVESLVRAGKVFDPQRYGRDRGIRRMIDVCLTEYNQNRKFARYYPKPTDTSF